MNALLISDFSYPQYFNLCLFRKTSIVTLIPTCPVFMATYRTACGDADQVLVCWATGGAGT